MTINDPRAAFAAANKGLHSRASVPQAVVDDIVYFAGLAKEGMPVSFVTLQAYIQKTHDYKIGRMKAETICKNKGLDIWWSGK